MTAKSAESFKPMGWYAAAMCGLALMAPLDQYPELMLFLSGVCVSIAWAVTLLEADTDPLHTSRRFDAPLVKVIAVGGVTVGGLAFWILLHSEQRHLMVVPALWAAVTTGIGTGALGVWSLLSEYTRQKMETARKHNQQLAHESVAAALQERQIAMHRAEGYRTMARKLDELADTPPLAGAELSERGQGLLQLERQLASEIARALARTARDDLLDPAGQANLAVLASDSGELTDALVDAMQVNLFEMAAHVFDVAGPPGVFASVDSGLSKGSDDRGRASLAVVETPRTRLEGWLRESLGYDAVVGPRYGAVAALHLVLVSLVVFSLHELPISRATLVIMVPLLAAVAVADMWLCLKTPGSIPVLISHCFFGFLLLYVCLDWLDGEVIYPGEQDAYNAVPASMGFVVGWWLGAWGLRWRVPYPARVEQPTDDIAPPALEDLVSQWRGAFIAGSWRQWLAEPIVLWLNDYVAPTLNDAAALRRQLQATSDAVFDHREKVLAADDNWAELCHLARACASLHAVARWQVAMRHFQELLPPTTTVDGDRLTRILSQASLDDWLTNYGADAPVPIMNEQAAQSALCGEHLYPPNPKDITGGGGLSP